MDPDAMMIPAEDRDDTTTWELTDEELDRHTQALVSGPLLTLTRTKA